MAVQVESYNAWQVLIDNFAESQGMVSMIMVHNRSDMFSVASDADISHVIHDLKVQALRLTCHTSHLRRRLHVFVYHI